MHFDWLPATTPSMQFAGNRLSSFFVYLHADCDGGNTVFPGIPRPPASEWCDALQCRDENGREVEAVEIRPRVGRAVFWYNLDLEGNGDEKTLHAGMPVVNGSKVGMNIWTRERSWRSKVKLMD
jgi:prolyl 4-hydroxylase